MNIDIFTSICEEKAIRDSEFTLGRKETVNLNPTGNAKIRHALSNLLTTLSSFVL